MMTDYSKLKVNEFVRSGWFKLIGFVNSNKLTSTSGSSMKLEETL
jgi:hypothetical protein